MASGAGRLFEAAGALLGLATHNDWEGEAAVRLEGLAANWPDPAELWKIESNCSDIPVILPSIGLLAEAARRLLRGEPPSCVAASFHATFCELAARLVIRISQGVRGPVALGGGCLANRLLREGLRSRLEEAGFEPLLATSIPPGDGGLSYGQAALASVATARGVSLASELIV